MEKPHSGEPNHPFTSCVHAQLSTAKHHDLKWALLGRSSHVHCRCNVGRGSSCMAAVGNSKSLPVPKSPLHCSSGCQSCAADQLLLSTLVPQHALPLAANGRRCPPGSGVMFNLFLCFFHGGVVLRQYDCRDRPGGKVPLIRNYPGGKAHQWYTRGSVIHTSSNNVH